MRMIRMLGFALALVSTSIAVVILAALYANAAFHIMG